MSGEPIRVLTALLTLLALAASDPAAAARADSQRQAPSTRPPEPLREPAAVKERLQAICTEAGYRRTEQRSCTEALVEACRREGLAPDSPRCWQWLVDRNRRPAVDRRAAPAAQGAPIDLSALRASGASARDAAGALHRAGSIDAAEAAAALHAARYRPRDIEQALVAQYRVSRSRAGRLVRAARDRRPSADVRPGHVGGREVAICVTRDGTLTECPAGSPPTGGGLTGEGIDPGTAPSQDPPATAQPEPGLGDWLAADAASFDWHHSYVLALLSYYIYSDAFGSPATAKADFRELMQSWGMEDVEFVETPEIHLRGAVVWGDDLVVVVLRGSELQATSHCVLTMMFPGLCAHLPANWVTNLSFAPMRQRPEWGQNLHLRTHPGFDMAVDRLFDDLLDRVEAELTPSRRLFVTGHSLGGAMATLFAFRAQALEEVPVHGVYTYGAPRLMNVPFAAHYQALLGPRTHRWQNRSDPVPALPPGQPIGENPIPPLPALVARETYRHTGRLHYLPNGSGTDADRSAEPIDLPGSISEAMVGDHMMARTPGSYVNRIHQRLSQASRGSLPAPPD